MRLLLKRQTRVRFLVECIAIHSFPAWHLEIIRDNLKLPPCKYEAGGKLTGRPKGPFAFSWPSNLINNGKKDNFWKFIYTEYRERPKFNNTKFCLASI